jgi:hypothetical protein
MARTVKKARTTKAKKTTKKASVSKKKKVTLKGVKSNPKAKKRKETIENIEVLENIKFFDLKPEMVDTSSNCIYRKVTLHKNKWRKSEKAPETYWGFDYGRDYWYWKRPGRVNTEYRIWELRFFDKNGVIYKTRSVFCKDQGYSKIDSPFVRFKDVAKIHYKRKEDFSMNEPFIKSAVDNPYDKQAQAVLYIPMRYLEEMGYTFKEETKVDPKMNYTYKKRLQTRIFSFEVEEKTWHDFNAMKKNLLKRLKNCKKKKDVAEAVLELTNLYVYVSQYDN